MRVFSYHDRPYHLSHFPLERLPQAERAPEESGRLPVDGAEPSIDSITHVCLDYFAGFARLFDEDGSSPPALLAEPVGRASVESRAPQSVAVAPARAPVPDDLEARANNMKASAYYVDAAMAGVCELKNTDWLRDGHPEHSHAFVFLVEFGREPAKDAAGADWIGGSQTARGDVLAAEIASVLAAYLRAMGFSARGHVSGATDVRIEDLIVRAGLALPRRGTLQAPFIGKRFRAGVVTTEYAMAVDKPLKSLRSWWSHGPTWWFGLGGTESLIERWSARRRPLHRGRYPMEKIQRADEPTTLVLKDEIKRAPMRASGFTRARFGDFGEKVQRAAQLGSVNRHPFTRGMGPARQSLAPHSGTREPLTPTGIGGDLSDPKRNAEAIKALGHYLGADFVGICEAEPWMFYSHNAAGDPIEPYHKYVVTMLIDQGYETMEGASGDDFISGSQSLRTYLRGATIAGIMAAHCRRMGYSSRVQNNTDSEILHNPAILMSGLGEVSRIGDALLNPFIGPRSKSVLFSTDLPLAVDRPIDAGVQHFCEKCNKCARECPCNAIPFGPKVMFNGYETWRMDAVKCTSYRMSNEKGSYCGRCMKMCPWNTEGLARHRVLMWVARTFPQTNAWIARMDDKWGNGSRNPVKKWWFDMEIVDGVCVPPVHGVNQRDLNLKNAARGQVQKLTFLHPSLWPDPRVTGTQPLDRSAAIHFYEEAELPDHARKRLSRASAEELR